MEHVSEPLGRVLASIPCRISEESIFAADDHGLEACLCLNRAAEARTSGARAAYVAKAAEHFAKALSLLNPATPDNDPLPPASIARAA